VSVLILSALVLLVQRLTSTGFDPNAASPQVSRPHRLPG